MNVCRTRRDGNTVSVSDNSQKTKYGTGFLVLLFLVPWIAQGATGPMTLDRAEQLALQADPSIIASQSTALALQDQSVADGQLPDPKLGVGIYNVPVNDFSVTREPTTQFRTRLQQAFPRGDTLHYRQKHTEWLGKAELAKAGVNRHAIRRDVRQTYLELYYQLQAAHIVEQNRELFQQLVDITRSHFATGRVSQQDVLQAQLELSRLEDKATQIAGNIAEQQAKMTRWLGDEAWQPIDTSLPSLPALPSLQKLRKLLVRHPSIQTASAQVEANQQMIKAAREQYKPGWNLGVEYRKRFGDDPDGSDRDDMMAAMVTVDLPLFNEKRQDKRLAASRQKTEAAVQLREQRLRELRRMLESDYAQWKRLGAQEVLYHDRLLAEAKDNAAAALSAYQSGTNEFTTLMRARITELDIRLQDLRIRIDRSKVQARLLYLVPETQTAALRAEGVKP